MRKTLYISTVVLLTASVLLALAMLLGAVFGFAILGIPSEANRTSNAGALFVMIGGLIAGINFPPILRLVPLLGFPFQILLVALLAIRLLRWLRDRKTSLPSVLPPWATVLFSISFISFFLGLIAVLAYPVLPSDLAYGSWLVGMWGVSLISAPAALLLSPTFVVVELMSRSLDARSNEAVNTDAAR